MLPLKPDYINPDDINGYIAQPRCNHRQRYRAVTSTADSLEIIEWWFLQCFLGPQRTSPTVPKNMPTPQRVQHNTPAMRKNPSLSRNGGSDAEIMELNQQVELYLLLHTNWTFIHRRLLKKEVFLFFQVDGVEIDCGRTGEGERFLLWQTTGHWADLPGTREWKPPHPQQDNGHSLCNRGSLTCTQPSTLTLQRSVCFKTLIPSFPFCCLTCRKVLHRQRRMTSMNKLTWARTNTDPFASHPPENSIFLFLFIFDLICFLLCTLYKYSPFSPTHPPPASSFFFLLRISVSKAALLPPSGRRPTTHSYSAASYTAPLLHGSNVKHIPVSTAWTTQNQVWHGGLLWQNNEF